MLALGLGGSKTTRVRQGGAYPTPRIRGVVLLFAWSYDRPCVPMMWLPPTLQICVHAYSLVLPFSDLVCPTWLFEQRGWPSSVPEWPSFRSGVGQNGPGELFTEPVDTIDHRQIPGFDQTLVCVGQCWSNSGRGMFPDSWRIGQRSKSATIAKCCLFRCEFGEIRAESGGPLSDDWPISVRSWQNTQVSPEVTFGQVGSTTAEVGPK